MCSIENQKLYSIINLLVNKNMSINSASLGPKLPPMTWVIMSSFQRSASSSILYLDFRTVLAKLDTSLADGLDG